MRSNELKLTLTQPVYHFGSKSADEVIEALERIGISIPQSRTSAWFTYFYIYSFSELCVFVLFINYYIENRQEVVMTLNTHKDKILMNHNEDHIMGKYLKYIIHD